MTEARKPKAAIIGFGNIASLGHLPALRELDIDVVAAVDLCEKRRKMAEDSGLKALKDLDELDPFDLDFIDICTPPSYRLKPIEFAVNRDLDVICEKPVSRPGDLSAIRELVQESSILFYPVHNWKKAPHYKKVKEIVRENGGVKNLNMNTLRTKYSSGNSDWNPGWRVDKDISGGGIIMDHGYHNIYLAMHLFGSDFEKAVLDEVEVFEQRPEIEKKASFTLYFPGDKKARICLDWGAGKREIKNTIYECNSSLELLDNKIVNSEHTYEFDESLSGDSVHGTWFREVFMDFLDKRGTPDNSYFIEAIRVMEGIEELYSQVG